MKLIDAYSFSMIVGFIGYCFNDIPGFVFGFVWAVAVVLILSIFGK